MKRPDLFACGRTLIGAAPPRGQNTDLNYFGTIPPRVKALFEEFQERAWKLGISSMVSHNEVAPAQHEFAPIYLVANAAADQNILSMDGRHLACAGWVPRSKLSNGVLACACSVLNQVAIDHGLMVLFHEKPFKGLNGSGKHNNWYASIQGRPCLSFPLFTYTSDGARVSYALCRTVSQGTDLDACCCAR
jgi:glutamine synthetase